MKKYVIYKCSICKRTKDVEVSHVYAPINKCTITLRCEGKLHPISTKSLRSILVSEPKSGIEDWYARGTELTESTATVDQKLISVISGNTPTVSIMVKEHASNNSDNVTIELSLAKDSVPDHKEYTYNKTGSFISVSGSDSTPNANVLKYEGSDALIVYLNGVQIAEDSGPTPPANTYNRNTPNVITFNQAIIESSTVKIIVYGSIPLTTKTITFYKNANTTSAWSNVNTLADASGTNWNVYTCNDLSMIPINSNVNVFASGTTILKNGSTQILETDVAFLFAGKPYSIHDRIFSSVVYCSNLQDEISYLKYHMTDVGAAFDATESSITSLFPHLTLSNIFALADETVPSDKLPGTTESELPVNIYVNGPV